MSSNTPHRTQKIGFKEEAAFGVDPITDGNETFYEFGVYTQSFGKFPSLESEILQSYKGTSYEPYDTHVSATKVIGNLVFIPTNGVMYYYLFGRKESSPTLEDGGVIDDGGSPPEFTITPVSDGELQSFTTRFITTNETDKIEKSIVGCRLNSLTLNLDLSSNRLPLGMSISIQGTKMVDVAANTDDYVIISPDSIETPFYFNGSNTLFTWDGVNLKDYLMSFSFVTSNFNRFDKEVSKVYPSAVITGDKTYGVSFTLRRSDETSVFTDYMAQAGTGDVSDDAFKNLIFKIFKDNGTDYLEFTFTNVAIQSINMNDAIADKQEVPTYEVLALVQSVVIKDQSGLTTQTFYGVGTS